MLFDLLLQVLSFHHDVGEVGKVEGDDADGFCSSSTKLYLLLRHTACRIQYTPNFRQRIERYLLISELEVQVDFARGQDEDPVVDFVLDDDLLAGLIYLISQIDDEFLVGFDRQSSQIFDIQQLKLLPASIFILVLDQILLHPIFDLWKDGDYLLENFLFDPADIAIVLGLDSCSPPLARNERNLSKVLSWRQYLHERVLPILILHFDFTLAL